MYCSYGNGVLAYVVEVAGRTQQHWCPIKHARRIQNTHGFAGIHGDKKAGIRQLEIAADRGRYPRPFAKILLALAALREMNPEIARAQLSELVAGFPENPLFANELAKVKVTPAAAISPR